LAAVTGPILSLDAITKHYPGVVALDAIQHPVEIGRRTIEAVAARLRGDSVPPRIPIPVDIVDRDSLRIQRGPPIPARTN
jgi:ABC-type sugar transport system substrate-binding protein